MEAAAMRSPGTSRPARRDRRDPMARNPDTPGSMNPSRVSSTERPAITRHRRSCTARLIMVPDFIMVRAGVGGGIGKGFVPASRTAAPDLFLFLRLLREQRVHN